jgi:hypothetical protein
MEYQKRSIKMTIISAIISKFCCAHASDSLLTKVKEDGKYEIIEDKKTKIIPVRHFSGAMALMGISLLTNGFSMLEWLREQAEQANQFGTAEEFAKDISMKLNYQLSRIMSKNKSDKGIGIHFTAYEEIDGVRIPELFFIRNYKNTGYKELIPEGVQVSRNTYDSLPEQLRNGSLGEKECRIAVFNYLENGGIFLFNNGDTEMFNPALRALLDIFRVAVERKQLIVPRTEKAHRRFIQRPIYLVAEIQKNYIKEGYRLVGGKIHNISITPSGNYGTDTEDIDN